VIGQFKLLFSDETEESVILELLGQQGPREVDEEGDCNAGEGIGYGQFVELLTNVRFPAEGTIPVAGALVRATIIT